MPNPSLIERKERWARKMSGKAKPAVRSENRLPPGQHLTPGFPVLDLGIKPDIPLTEWRLEVGGLVENPQTFTWEQFNALPQFEDVSDFHCVTTWSKFDCRWRGVALFTLVELVRPKPEVKHVLFTSYESLRRAASALSPWLAKRNLALYSQADGAPQEDVLIRSTQAEIAHLAGTSRESASRFLATLERAGIVTLGRGKVTVHDPGRLRNYIH